MSMQANRANPNGVVRPEGRTQVNRKSFILSNLLIRLVYRFVLESSDRPLIPQSFGDSVEGADRCYQYLSSTRRGFLSGFSPVTQLLFIFEQSGGIRQRCRRWLVFLEARTEVLPPRARRHRNGR
jgi:hypothetical protein